MEFLAPAFTKWKVLSINIVKKKKKKTNSEHHGWVDQVQFWSNSWLQVPPSSS